MTRIAIFDNRLYNLGGGSRHAFALATAWARHAQVDYLHEGAVDARDLAQRWDVEPGAVNLVQVPEDDDAAVSALSRTYDVLVDAALGRFITPQSRKSAFFAFFPAMVDLTPRGTLRRAIGSGVRAMPARIGVRLLNRLSPGLSKRLANLPSDRQVRALKSHDMIITNAEYTRRWVRHYWRRDSVVLYPVIRPIAALSKQRSIVHIGRFFHDPNTGHSKGHLAMAEAFARITDRMPDWTLHFVGGINRDAAGRAYYERVLKLVDGKRVQVHAGLSQDALDQLVGSASMYWHATGYGADLATHPGMAEHFGMSIVEAMSARTTPVVFRVGGPSEIITHDVDGMLWNNIDELVEQTLALAHDPRRCGQLGAQAHVRSMDFLWQPFQERADSILADLMR